MNIPAILHVGARSNVPDWNAFVIENAPRSGAFLQSWEWGEVLNASGEHVFRLARNRNESMRAQAQLSRVKLPLGISYEYLMRGPIAVSGSAEADMLNRIVHDQSGFTFARVESIHEVREKVKGHKTRTVDDVQPSVTLITDLTQDEEGLSGAMHHKTRYNSRLAEKKGVQVDLNADSKEDFEDFMGLAQETASRHSIRIHPREHFEEILRKLNGEGDAPKAFLAIARHDGDVLVANLMIDFAGTRTYLHGASSDAKKNLMAPYLLHFELMKDAKGEGLKNYDWWGIAPEGSEGHRLSGVTRFKKGFGGEVVVMPRTFDVIRKPGMYLLYRLAKKILRR